MPSGECAKCGTWRKRLHRHRIKPGHKGGTYAAQNVERLCANCHEDEHPGPGIEHVRSSKRPPKERLERLYAKHTLREVAAILGTAMSNVQLWLTYYEIPVRPTGVSFHPRKTRIARPARGKFVARYEGGESVDVLAQSYGVSTTTIKRWLDEFGVTRRSRSETRSLSKAAEATEPRRRGGRPKKRPPDTDLLALRAEGLTQAQIGERYGVTQAAVQRWLKSIEGSGDVESSGA